MLILFNQRRKNLAIPADANFLFIRCFAGALTQGAVQKPAEMTALKLPGRAIFFFLTFLLFPAGDEFRIPASLLDEEEEQLTFNMGRDRPPPLLVAVDGF